MISKYIKEQKRYTQKELVNIFGCTEDDAIKIIKKLKEYGVLKSVKYNDHQKDLSDLADEDILVTDVSDNNQYCYFVFTFVGVIIISGLILKCYPKYIHSNNAPLNELKDVIKVIERYNQSKDQTIKLFNGGESSSSFNQLAIILYLLKDYAENGSYSNSKDIVETNGMGEILWDKTINETFTYISENQPYYIELQTQKRISNENDYFKRLHECVLTLCSKEIENTELTDLFEDIGSVDLTDEMLDDFGETSYILDRIEKELNVQFNTHKQLILKTLYAYISERKILEDIDSFSMFGTNSFNLIWEEVCRVTFDDVLHTKLRALKLPKPLDASYKSYEQNELIEIIEKPCWKCAECPTGQFGDTLIPDIIAFDNDKFLIFDAKYYNLTLEKDKTLSGQPGIESITKQYLYQLAYKDFINKNGFNYISNCFLMPCEGDIVIDKGTVSLNILDSIGLKSIQARLLPAKILFKTYLNQELFDLSLLKV